MKIQSMTLVSCAFLISACNGADGGASNSDGGGAGDPSAEVVKFHPQENFCVEYETSGTFTGMMLECMRKWGTERVEIEDYTIGFGGFTQSQKAHKIYLGDQIYNINPDTMTGTVTTNPLYNDLSETDAIALGEAMMANMGMVDSGEDKTIAGVECNVMTSPQMGSVCLTDNLVMLEQNFAGLNRIAISVDLTSGGADENYTLHEDAQITEGPDVEAILEAI